MKAILKNKQIVIGGSIVLAIIILVLLAPVITSGDYASVDLANKNSAPCIEHLLGTDSFGRDVWTRILYGGRISLSVAVCASLLAAVCGTFIGCISAYFGKTVDFIIGRIMDIFMAFPMLLSSLIIGIILEASVSTMFLSIGIPCIPMFYRMARANTLSLRERGYVKAAASMGSGHMHIIFRHIIPNALPHILVVFSSVMGGCVLAESSLGFLGFGIPQPTPSWGLVVNEGKSFMFQYPWTTGFAGLFIALTSLGFNLLGDGIRDHFDPKIRNSRM